MNADTPLSPTDIADKLATHGSVHLRVKVIPNSSFDSVMGLLADGTLKVRISAAPDKGKANEALCTFLAEDFDASSARIVSGETSEIKLVELSK